MAGGLSAVVVAIGAGWVYVRRRLAASACERTLEAALTALPRAQRITDDDGRDAVRANVLDVPVLLYPGAPRRGDPDWMTGLGAVACYVNEHGPAFAAGSREPDAHLRAAGPVLPLRALYGRTIPVTGEHAVARELITRSLSAIEPTGAMTAPVLRSDGREVSAWIARIPPDDELAGVITGLTRLVAGLARWRIDVLDEYAAAVGAEVTLDPAATPPLSARLDLGKGAGAILLHARYVREPDRLVGAQTFAIRASGSTALAIPRERVPLERLQPDAARRVPADVLARAHRALIRGEPGRAILEWARPPTTGEMVAAVELLTALAPGRSSAGPFR